MNITTLLGIPQLSVETAENGAMGSGTATNYGSLFTIFTDYSISGLMLNLPTVVVSTVVSTGITIVPFGTLCFDGLADECWLHDWQRTLPEPWETLSFHATEPTKLHFKNNSHVIMMLYRFISLSSQVYGIRRKIVESPSNARNDEAKPGCSAFSQGL